MDSRKSSSQLPIPLPVDYLKMMEQVIAERFKADLKEYQKVRPEAYFKACGQFFSEELLIAVSLMSPDHLSATTVYVSGDIDLNLREAELDQKLSLMVDLLESQFEELLSTERNSKALEILADPSLSALKDVAIEWVKVGSGPKALYTRVDKANIVIDTLADDWLSKNDPEFLEKERENQVKMEGLFITGRPKNSTFKH